MGPGLSLELRDRLGHLQYDLMREASAAVYAATQLAPKLLVSRAARRNPFNAAVPRQAILPGPALPPELTSYAELKRVLDALRIRYVQGRHTVYIPPQAQSPNVFGELVAGYPRAPGLKLLKRFEAPETAQYLHDARNRWVTARLMGGVRHQADAASVLFALGLGPRLHDVVALSSATTHMTGFVVEHVDGGPPSLEQHAAFVARLAALLSGDLRDAVALATPWQLRHADFAPPDCNGNLVYSRVDGRLLYVDFQPFMVIDRGRVVEHLLRAAGLASDGPTFAAQVDAAARRWRAVAEMLGEHHIPVAGRVVLDTDCGLGLMLAGALAGGARWGIGWTHAAGARAVEGVQSVWGNTRLSVLPASAGNGHRLSDGVPDELRTSLAEAIVLHLDLTVPHATVSNLGALPWRMLVSSSGTDADYRRIETSYHCRLLAETSPGATPRLSVFVRD